MILMKNSMLLQLTGCYNSAKQEQMWQVSFPMKEKFLI